MANSEYLEMIEEGLMPWGKHKGEDLDEIEDDYWKWFLKQDWCGNWPELVEYAEKRV